MSEIDDLEGGESGESGVAEVTAAAAVAAGAACLACGGALSGAYCSTCGQKNDDLRRSSLVLIRDFLRDTFGFDSRMWRTLGLLALSPGRVPKDYAHGRRSRFTPPVRLFLVVSFLFFLTIGLTNTLFVGLEVEFRDPPPKALEEAAAAATEAGVALDEVQEDSCSFQGKLRFFIKENDLATDRERLDACMGGARDDVRKAISESEEIEIGENQGAEIEREHVGEAVDRVFRGLNWVLDNPRAFNNSFNNWLPRVLLFMTPVLALLLALFLRRDVLIFDHLVLAFYTHAASFAIICLSLILAQFGAPLMGVAAVFLISVYYIAVLKRAYGRGWLKTIWTAVASGALYMMILATILMSIMSRAVWQAAV